MAFLLLPGLVLAQESRGYVTCIQKAETQSAMTACASEEASHADAELNAVYRKLLAQVAGDKVGAAKIKTAYKAWLDYRDAYLEAMYPAEDKQAAYGTIYPTEVNLLRAKLTRQQTSDLRDLLGQYGRTRDSSYGAPVPPRRRQGVKPQ
jgi:uncharacterized protein YecT (DUF1311 family)